ATSRDLKHFEKQGIIVPQFSYTQFESLTKGGWDIEDRYLGYCNCDPFIRESHLNNLIWDKDVMFFPQRINGKLHFLHRIKPDIQLVAVDELSELTTEFWEKYISRLKEHTILFPKYEHEISYIGGGAPPI